MDEEIDTDNLQDKERKMTDFTDKCEEQRRSPEPKAQVSQFHPQLWRELLDLATQLSPHS